MEGEDEEREGSVEDVDMEGEDEGRMRIYPKWKLTPARLRILWGQDNH